MTICRSLFLILRKVQNFFTVRITGPNQKYEKIRAIFPKDKLWHNFFVPETFRQFFLGVKSLENSI